MRVLRRLGALALLMVLAGPLVAEPREPAPPSAVEGLTITELAVGKGNPVTEGAWVRVHYTGWLQDTKAPDGKGVSFDSSLTRAEPFVFQVGKQQVIRGWDLGLLGMRAGGKRRLVIPPALGYGPRGAGNGVIPPNATLLFDIELLDFLPAR